MKRGIVKVTFLYTGGEDVAFDFDYYLSNHIPLLTQKLGDLLIDMHIDKGISGGAPGSIAPYAAMGHFYIKKLETFVESFTLNSEEIMADIKNFTDSKPVIQVSEELR